MRLRSLLFVPGDRPERFEKAAASGADAIILDLEDSVAIAAKPKARDAIAAFLDSTSAITRFVRINPVDREFLADDLGCVSKADGVVLPKCETGTDVQALLAHVPEHLKILPIASETPMAVFGMRTYAQVSDRLAGLTWGAEDLPAAIGAVGSRNEDGSFTHPYEMVRSLVLFGAHAAGANAIETVFPAIKDEAALARYAARGAFDGFTGMMALHPAQVPIINAAFTPTEQQIEAAQKIIDAFAQAPDVGVLMIDGQMVDAPHLAQARKIIERAG